MGPNQHEASIPTATAYIWADPTNKYVELLILRTLNIVLESSKELSYAYTMYLLYSFREKVYFLSMCS